MNDYFSRRHFLTRSGLGFGGLALGALLARDGGAVESSWRPPTGLPHFPARAKSVIWIFLCGGVSHLESFDHKPEINRFAGKTIAETPYADVQNPAKLALERAPVPDANGLQRNVLFPLQTGFKKHGHLGIGVADWFPELAKCVDEMAFVRSMYTTDNDHGAEFQMHTGRHHLNEQQPVVGSWVSYGLGTLNRNLPSFVVIAPQTPYAGDQAWGSDFLPASHQGTRVVPGATPIANIGRRLTEPGEQERELAYLQKMNREHLASRPHEPDLAARIKSFETAYGMQMEAPDLFDLSHEKDHTLNMYGMNRGQTSGFGWQCLMARRMVERGVRFVELIDTGSSNNWDAHGDMATHTPLAQNVDKPIAGLLKDLKQRGMLDETLVCVMSEHGRTPRINRARGGGRDHWSQAYTCMFAGGGVGRGRSDRRRLLAGRHFRAPPVSSSARPG